MAAIAADLAFPEKFLLFPLMRFSPGRNWEQIRTTISYNDSNVKIAGAHAGISVGPDGATHQAVEDIATMRVMANMRVIVPCDAIDENYSRGREITGSCLLRLAEKLRFRRKKPRLFPEKPVT